MSGEEGRNLIRDGERCCFLCQIKFSSLKQLKVHLLLSHPKSHVCLFCIERKGWSDEFPSQPAYNSHYKTEHTGVIEERREERKQLKTKDRLVKQQQRDQDKRNRLGANKEGDGALARRMRDPKSCHHCPEFPVFDSGFERDKHLVSAHKYDTCKVCRLIGPYVRVMLHVASEHPHQLCHLCGAQSPLFSKKEKVLAHIRDSHSLPASSTFFCHICDDLPLADRLAFLEHFQVQHNADGSGLKPIKRKRNQIKNQDFGFLDSLKPISGLKNENHRDCNLLTVLHLLAQTSLPEVLIRSCTEHVCLTHGSCILGDFFDQYKSKVNFFPHRIIENPRRFGDSDSFPLTLIDLIKIFLRSASNIHTDNIASSMLDHYKTILEWKFECSRCKRFVKTRLNDFVLSITAGEANSFESHLNKFLLKKQCSCGHICESSPSVKQSGDFLFVEIDRKTSVKCLGVRSLSSDEFEVSLYPLKLHRNYNIFSENYKVFATINYNLDFAEGGHYVLNILVGKDEVLKVHEDSVEKLAIPPAFDNDTVIVCLQKITDNKKGESAKCGNGVDSDSVDVKSSVIEGTNSQQHVLHDPLSRKTNCIIPNNSCSTVTSSTDFSSSVGPHDQVLGQGPDEGSTRPSLCRPKFDPSCSEAGDSVSSYEDESDLNCDTLEGEPGVRENIMLLGDNMRLYLNDDKSVVEKYRQKYLKKVEDEMNHEINSIKDVSLKSLGGQVLDSKIYRIQSLSGSKKRRKKFNNLDSNMIDNNENPSNVDNMLSLPLNIPENVGELNIIS